MNRRLPFLSALALMFTVAACSGETTEPAANEPDIQVVEITAGAAGYSPKQIELQAGVPARLVFTRTTPSACLEQVRIPAFGIAATDLPMHEPVVIEFTPDEAGTFSFICGMDMQHGTLVVAS